jgi:hypothetical protein
MPEQIIFRGAYIRRFTVDGAEAGGVFVKVYLGCDFTKTVREAMKWGELPEGFTEATLTGELNAQTMTMDPGTELEKHKFELPIAVADHFQVVSLVVPEKPNRLELRFQVKTAAVRATRTIDDYYRTLGDKRGQLRISYVEGEEGDGQGKLGLAGKDDKQEPLPLKGDAAAEHEQTQKGRKGKPN